MTHLYNEINPYRVAVLRARIAEGRLPHGTVDERDITTIPDQDFLGFDQVHLFAGIGGFPLGLALAGVPDGLRCVTGGFPCQDISNAGKRAGITGERSGLWREMVRAVRVVRPDLVFVENVAALLGRGMGRVVGDLASIGYDAKWTRVSAADAGAPHLRERIWIMAYPQRINREPWRWIRDVGSAAPTGIAETSQRERIRDTVDDSGTNVAYPEQSERRPSVAGRNDAHGHHDGREEAASGPEQRREALAHGDRERLAQWSEQDGESKQPEQQSPRWRDACGRGEDVAFSDEFHVRTGTDGAGKERGVGADSFPLRSGRWPTKSSICRMADGLSQELDRNPWLQGEWEGVPRIATGIANRIHRLAALGDAIVPQACAEAIRRLMA